MSTVWDKRIDKAEKFMEKYLEHGKKVYCLYEDDREDVMYRGKKVNFFYANVNTMKESLFNSLPKPDVNRLHRGDFQDDVSRVAACIMSRCLTYEVHCAPNFKEAITNAILEVLVPGMGQVWLSFSEGEITCDHVFWEDYIQGPARKWSDVPWVGRKQHFTKAEVIEKYGAEALKLLEQDMAKSVNDQIKQILQDKFVVYEIWEKKTRKVFHIAKGASAPLLELDDPLRLRKFFPCPKPLMANLNTKKFLPVTDYYMAQDQYDTINILYQRINLIVKAIKVAGLYDSGNTAVSQLLAAEENKMIPVDNWAMFAERGGAKGLIDWYPVEVVAQVLVHLQGQVEVEKALLYEITGMSDIMRGASNQYETAKAQQIKAQFAGVRIAAKQRDVGEFVGDILSIMAEMATQLYDDQKIQQIVGDLPPEDAQFAPMAMQVLRSDMLVRYKVSVQADSMTEADWQLEKEQRMEVVGAIGQIFSSALPIVEQAPQLLPMVVHLVKFAVVGYKAGRELEGWLDGQLDKLLQQQLEAERNPQPEEPSPEDKKAEAEIQKIQMEAETKQREADQKMQLEQQKMAMEQQMMEQKLQFEREMAEIKIMLQQALAQMKLQEAQVQGQVKREQASMDMAMKAEEHAMGMEQAEMEHEMNMENTQASAEQDLENKKKQAAMKPKKGADE